LSSPSNLYAEKAFSEHPIALWSLDDAVDYVSYITEPNRRFYDYSTQWEYSGLTPSTGENGTVVSLGPYEESVDESFLFKDSAITKITPPSILSGTGTFSITSRFTFDCSADTFSIGFYLYSVTNMRDVTVTVTSGDYNQSKTVGPFLKNRQNHIMANFSTDTTLNGVEVSIEFTYDYSDTLYSIYLNGFSVGTLSEEFSATSLGTSLVQLPSSIALPTSYGARAYAYASIDNYGYYMSKNNVLLAKNSTMPMVFGAANSTILMPSGNDTPSLVLPGVGFLNEIGQKNNLTFEAWLKINALEHSSQRIIGPIASEDGLYVEGPFLVLRVGNKTCSHFMGEWFRPILLDILLTPKSASMMINGELVSSIDLSDQDQAFASATNSSGKSQDWIGFYVADGVKSIEVDCVAVYPYEVSELLAKKKFVAGQAVSYPQDVNVAYSGESLFIDYAFANYSKTYDYPGVGSWLQGVSENLDVSSQRISSPTYSLPKISCNAKSFTLEKLTSDLFSRESNLETISLFPNSDWNGKNSYLYFDSLNILKSPVDGIFGVFKKLSTDNSTNKQVLIKVKNKSTGDYISAILEDTTITYSYKKAGRPEVMIPYSQSTDTPTITKGTKFSAGFSISKLISVRPELAKFFSNRNKLSVYLLGDYSGEDISRSNTFTGNVYHLGFMTAKNSKEFAAIINSKGFLNVSNGTISGASYELCVTTVANAEKLEIKTKSYWDSHVPLSALSKMSLKADESSYDTIDFFQVNLDYPQVKNASTMELDLSNDLSKTYITFQYVAEGANEPSSSFTLAEQTPDQILVVEPTENWKTEKYLISDGSVVYPPILSDGESVADLAVCFHIEMTAPASISNKLFSRFLRISSQSQSDNSSNAISPINAVGSRFGKGLYPYKETVPGGFPNKISYKERNPFRIFRGSSPHLYLTNNSGISLSGAYDSEVDRGIFFRLNREAVANTNVSSIQMSMLWNNKLFPETKQKIFEIISGTGTFLFYVKASTPDRQRAEITVELVSGNSTVVPSTVFFYWNGRTVSRPTITIGEWGMLGIVFKPYLTFDSGTGFFKITSEMMINNISTYQLDPSIQAQQIVYRTWQDLSATTSDDDWDEWSDGQNVARTWQEMVYQVASFTPSIDPISIYQVYIGTNKIISDSSSNSGVVGFKNYEYSIYQNVERDTFVIGML